jgi:hypothetical protein
MRFTVKIETCPKCGSNSTENLVRVETGLPIKVYIRCSACAAFVACYALERYTSDKTYESLLRFMRKHGHCVASRSRAQELDGFSKKVEEEFQETSNASKSNLKLEEIICEHKR